LRTRFIAGMVFVDRFYLGYWEMNERIKELAALATTEEKDGFKYFDKEKFAKLIVQECMTINRQRLFPNYEGDSHRVAHNNALLCANSDLEKHFQS
jgi:hypothetical protein